MFPSVMNEKLYAARASMVFFDPDKHFILLAGIPYLIRFRWSVMVWNQASTLKVAS